MAITTEERRLLSLTKQEEALLKYLEKRQASMQEIAETLKRPRTSLYWPLTQLEKRNLVGYRLVGKRKRWYSRLSELPLRGKLGSLQSAAGDVRVVEGVESMRELWAAAFDRHPGERMTILEGNAAVYSVTEKTGIDFMLEGHKRAYERKIVIESILGEKVYADMAKQRVNPRIVKSLAQWNTWIGYVVPDEWIESDAAVLIFSDSVILADWTRERAILINTPEIVALLKSLCSVFQLIGRKVDIVSYVRSIASQHS